MSNRRDRHLSAGMHKFDNRVRQPQKSVTDYVKELRHLASYCKFTDKMRNKRLRDRFIAGIRNGRMVRPLLAEKLTEIIFDSAVSKKCIAIEQASRELRLYKGAWWTTTRMLSIYSRSLS